GSRPAGCGLGELGRSWNHNRGDRLDHFRLPECGVERLLEQHVVTREGQLDAQQFLSGSRLEANGSGGKVLIAEPDLSQEPVAAKPLEAERRGALTPAGVDQETADAVLVRIIRSKFEGHVDPGRRHPAANPCAEEPRLSGGAVAAVKDRDPWDV